MPHSNLLNDFDTHFDNFCRNKEISNSPSFGICYRGRNSRYLHTDEYSQRKNLPIIHKLNSEDEAQNSDLKFIENLENKLRKELDAKQLGKYIIETGYITIPMELSSQSDESRNELPNLIYVFGGMTKNFYETIHNKIKEKKDLDYVALSMIFWGLKNDKNPLELIFNYYPQEAPDELLRVIKDKELEILISKHDLSNF
ncbi:MAG: hypothetical protein ACP5NZ_02530 [Nanobdellota archaeon]